MTNYLINNGRLIDCTGAEPKKDASLFVAGDRIAKVGPADEVKAYAASQGAHETVEASGLTIMPGIIDCHVHPSYGDITSFEELDFYPGVEYRTLRATHALKQVLRAGVTSIAAPGGIWNINVALRDAVNAKLIEGPRIAAGGHYLSTYNGIGSVWPSQIEHPKSSFSVLCNTREEFIKQARKEIKDGVDILKVAGDGDSLTSAGQLAGSISLDELQAVADVAHVCGKVCTIHARSGRAARDAALAGFDWLVHASFMSDEDLDVVVKQGTPINPTLSLLANTLEWGPDFGMPDRILDGYKNELEAAAGCLTKAHQAGLMIMAGTDSGQGTVPYGEWHAREMEHLMTYLGMSAMEALRAGTYNAAFALGMQDEIGTLEEGKLADVLVVDGDPLADIQVLQDKSLLRMIMKDGAIVDTATPLPQPTTYAWEKPMLYWHDSRVGTQDFVRHHARNKPAWMQETARAAAE